MAESRALRQLPQARLFPAIQKVSGQDPPAGEQPMISEFEPHDYVKP